MTKARRTRQNRLEWVLLSIIAIVCIVLSVLQYRWAGDLSTAERVRLRSGLDEQVRRLAHAFNDDIGENCAALVPEALDRHSAVYKEWANSHDPRLFQRVAFAVPERGAMKLFAIGTDGTVSPIAWPPEWASIRDAMAARINNAGPPPTMPFHSTVVEFPVFDQARGHEIEWMLFIIDEDYIRTQLLPRLIRQYLNTGSEPQYDVSVSWPDNGKIVFSTRADHKTVTENADVISGLFTAGMRPPARLRGSFGQAEPRTRWTIAVRHRMGSLERAVQRTRIRSLTISFLLIGLLGGAAWALVRYTARSRRLSDMQFRFAAGVSHDLRTPLTAIRGAAFNLVDGVVKEPASVERYARLILRNAEELTSMIENVLAFSASMQPDHEGQSEPFFIGDVLEHAASVMAAEIEQAGCRLELTIAPELPRMSGDRVAVERAIRNLIANAVRHASQGRWIGVSAARSGDGVEIRISDRGPGIPEIELAHIFEPFYRGERARAGLVRGTGLGLSLVKDTVERHHGTVAVTNSQGGGVQFTLHLPAMMSGNHAT